MPTKSWSLVRIRVFAPIIQVLRQQTRAILAKAHAVDEHGGRYSGEAASPASEIKRASGSGSLACTSHSLSVSGRVLVRPSGHGRAKGDGVEQRGWSGTDNQLSGDVHGAAVQAGSIQGGVHIHLTRSPTEPTVSAVPPDGWADLPELPVAVRTLLRAQVLAAQELPYRLPGARRPSLATVYVRQDLSSGSEDAASEPLRPTPIVDERGQLADPPSGPVVRLAVRPPARTVGEALDDDDHVLVTGGPGQGKSTLSLRLAADVAGRWMSPDADDVPLAEPVVPLRLTARELAARLSLPFPEAVAESVRVEYGALLGASLEASVLRDRVAGYRWLLLVDGLDEVADHVERDRLVTILAGWASDTGSPYRVVLTTRPIEGAALAPLQRIGAARYELQAFDEQALRHFADNWFDNPDSGYRFVRQIRAAHLDELVRVPLLATIAAIIFEQHSDRPLPDNRYELYESYLKYLRSAHPIVCGPFDQTCDPLLEHLGRVRLELDRPLAAAARDWAEQHVINLVGDWQEELTTYLAAVGPFVRRGDDLRFLHHSFAEHLAATAKARLLPERFEPTHADFARLLHAARPDERGQHARAVLLHHSRLHSAEADRLIGWLHRGGPDQHLLAARLLAWHVPAGPDVVDAFLATVRAWAMTSQYPGHEILAQASRASHHPGIATWLAELMRDEDAPWRSRVEAATALATRLRTADAPDAIAQLRLVIDDMTTPVTHRLAAAEALSECGGGERHASERGLRSVLADPSATAFNCRNAALVLAGFGAAARECAVEALTALLDDPWTPDNDLVEAATGLVEIGVEFHQRCAGVFRTVLGCRTKLGAGLEDAALGLASLGSHQLGEAVTALTSLITDRRLDIVTRTNAAETLAKLGPQHRIAAGEHLLAMSAEFSAQPSQRWTLAASLSQVGHHDRAAVLLRAVLADRTASPNNQMWVARTLADLGPEYHDEAIQTLRRVADHPKADGYDRAAALARLAGFGEPHRGPAVASLCSVLADRTAEPAFRCQVAVELTRLGPQFHSEAAEHLSEVTSCHADPDIQIRAWRALRNLGSRFRDQASAALLALLAPDEASSCESHRSRLILTRFDIDDHDSMAHALTDMLGDPSRSGQVRARAAGILVSLGRRYHRTALNGVIELIRSQVVPATWLSWTISNFAQLGAASRAELADALRAQLRHPHTTPATVSQLAEALEWLDYRADPEVVTALRRVVADDLVVSDVRGDAALALARAVPTELAHAAAVVLRYDDGTPAYAWERRVRELAALGADLVPRLRMILSSRNVRRRAREIAAGTLAHLRPDLRADMVRELRAQAGDEFLPFMWRTDAMLRLVELDPTTLDDAIAYHRSTLNDSGQPVRDRCEAACQLVQLDASFCQMAVAALRWFATSSEFTVDEHEVAVWWFANLDGVSTADAASLGLAVAHDPAATSWVRSQVCTRLRGRERLDVERSLLTDRTASPNERTGGLNDWEHPGLAAEAETVLRDILTAVETLPTKRVEAAAALAGLSPRHVPEAVRWLEELSAGQCAGADARDELVKLGQAWRRRMVAAAEGVVADEASSWRARSKATSLIMGLTSSPPEPVVDRLRRLVRDQRVSDNARVGLLYALGGLDGFDRLRQIRDDERTRPAIRWAAATSLRDYAGEDRAAGARVLNAIATNTTCRPTLRWCAARDLMSFGERGRELGAASLHAIMTGESLPVIARVDAARALGTARPDTRLEIQRWLRKFRTTEKPLARIQVFEAIGRFDANEGALALRDMAADHALLPSIRLRAADAMTELRRDYWETAALVARNVMRDQRVPHHVRTKAARALASWSDLCRAEAQSMLVALDTEWRGSV